MTGAGEGTERGGPRKRRRPPTLTARDGKLLAFLAEYGCVSAERIKDRFWQTSEFSRAHYRRIAILKKLGLVENVFGDGGITIGYRLSRTGTRFLRRLPEAKKLAINRRSYQTQFNHDQLLIDARSILESSPLVKDFRMEAEIRRQLVTKESKMRHWENLPIVPDGAFTLAIPGQEQGAALELELTLKKRSRYTRIFRNHLLSRRWNLVFYIAKNAEMQRQLMASLAEVKAKDVEVQVAKKINGIYFCTLDQFLTRRLAAPFTNGREEISLEEIARNFGLGSG